MLDRYISEYGDRLFGLALKLCRNREDAEDLYQETWIKAYRFIDRYDCEQEFGPWITGICVNSYKDMLRRQKWRVLFAAFSSNEEKERVLSNIPAEKPADYAEVRDAVNALPEKYRLVIILYYYNDLDIQKTADVLNIPVGTVKYHLHKAREILKRSLKADGYET